MPDLDAAKGWIVEHFKNSKEKFNKFVKKHRRDREWTDKQGIMCQATSLVVGRNIHLYGTINIGHDVSYTKLESVAGADKFPPLTILYYQDVHYQSLQTTEQKERDEAEAAELQSVSYTHLTLPTKA